MHIHQFTQHGERICYLVIIGHRVVLSFTKKYILRKSVMLDLNEAVVVGQKKKNFLRESFSKNIGQGCLKEEPYAFMGY